MAYIATSARYGTGVFGVAEYGVTAISVTVTGVSTSVAVAPVQVGGFEIDITERVDASLSATGSIGTIEVKVKEEVQQDNTVSANGAIGTVTPHASSKVIPDSVSAVGVVTTVEEQVKEEISASISAVGDVGSVTVHTGVTLASVSADGNIGIVILKVNSLARPEGDALTLAVLSEETELRVQEPLDISLVANYGFNGANVKVHVKEIVQDTVPQDAALGTINVTAEVFDFEAVKTQYSRRRTVIISRAA